jgi:hypothetical protein
LQEIGDIDFGRRIDAPGPKRIGNAIRKTLHLRGRCHRCFVRKQDQPSIAIIRLLARARNTAEHGVIRLLCSSGLVPAMTNQSERGIPNSIGTIAIVRVFDQDDRAVAPTMVIDFNTLNS